METRKETNVRKGRGYGRGCRHPTGSTVWPLSHSTVTRSIEKGRVKKAHSSNRDPISKEVFSNIAADIGRRGVVSAWIPQVFRAWEVDFQDDAIVWAVDPINWRMDRSCNPKDQLARSGWIGRDDSLKFLGKSSKIPQKFLGKSSKSIRFISISYVVYHRYHGA